jgi:hypothetical protein
MAASLAAKRSSEVVYGRSASRARTQAVDAHASWRAAWAACSSRALNRARPPGVVLEVTGSLRGLVLDGLRLANALGNTTSTLC